MQPGLQGRIAFVNSTRELLGVAFKMLGLTHNASVADLLQHSIGPLELQMKMSHLQRQVDLHGVFLL